MYEPEVETGTLAKDERKVKTFNICSVPAPVLGARKNMSFYYEPHSALPSLKELAGINTEQEHQLNPRHIAALRVIFTYCMRASEYLQCTESDIIGNDRVFIRGKKKSASYFIVLPGVCESLKKDSPNPVLRLLSGCTYIELYRACLKANIGMRLKGHTNVVRTHLARQKLVRESTQKHENKELSDCLHHRSNSSIMYYGAKKEVTYGKVKGWNIGNGKREGLRNRSRTMEG
jgi:integrase